MCKKLLTLFICFSSLAAGAQDTLTFLNYNLLKFPDTTSVANTEQRLKELRKIVQYVKPDIFVVNELINDSGAVKILNQSMNVNGTSYYRKAVYDDGPDTENMLFYNSQKLTLQRQRTLVTSPRYTMEYRLYYNDSTLPQHLDTVFLHIHQVHLKSSQGASNEQARFNQVKALRYYLDANNYENTFFSGDFNVYTSAEPAYQHLLSPGRSQFFDPINRPGNWHENSSFADIHTQSPRTTSFGGGVTGGMDDRFDFILVTADVLSGQNHVQYLPGSYRAIGNDGQHFNKSILDLPQNTSAPDSIIQALHNMSDHLPVALRLVVKSPSVTGLPAAFATGAPEMHFSTLNPDRVSMTGTGRATLCVASTLGQVLYRQEVQLTGQQTVEERLPGLPNGLYLISLTNGTHCLTRRAVVSR